MKQITVFATSGGSMKFANNFDDKRPNTLDGLIEYVLSKGAVPVAWAPSWINTYGGAKTKDELHAESLRLGRTIELVDGKYVARGVPGEPEKKEQPASSSCAKRDSDENHRPALTWDTTTRFDAFKGWEPVRSWVDFDELSNADHAYSDPLQKLGDTSNPLHGSFALVKKD